MSETDELLAELTKCLGVVIRAQRIRRGLSRDELAEMVNVSNTTMGRIERLGPVNVSDTWQLARALRVPLSDLVREAEHLWAEQVQSEKAYSEAVREQLVEIFRQIVPADPNRPAADYYWASLPIEAKVLTDMSRALDELTVTKIDEPADEDSADAKIPTLAEVREEKRAQMSEPVRKAARKKGTK